MVKHDPRVQQVGLGSQKVNRSFNQPRKERDQMKKVFAVVLSGLTAVSLSATAGSADTSCAVEVSQAKAMLQQKQQVSRTDVAAPRSLAGARVQEAPRSQQEAPRTEVQAPRSLAGARIQEAPRSQQEAPRSVQQAPRSQQEAPRSAQEAPRSAQEAPRSTQEAPRNIQQAPRSQQEAPRSQQEAPRGQQLSAPRGDLAKATALVNEADAACKAGNNSLASQKAKAAMDLIK